MHKEKLIKLVIAIQVLFCVAIMFRMYIFKSIYFNLYGLDSFQQKFLKINDNYKIIEFLNKNLRSDDGVIIDNTLFYYLKNKNYFMLNVNALTHLNNLDYSNYDSFINNNNIKFIVIYIDAVEGLIRFGYKSNKIVETINFYNNLDNVILELERKNKIRKIKIYERNAIYEIIK